jgi:hypothetical protein
MTSASASAIVLANRASRRNVGVQWAASLYEVQSWAVLKGSPNLRAATLLLQERGGWSSNFAPPTNSINDLTFTPAGGIAGRCGRLVPGAVIH